MGPIRSFLSSPTSFLISPKKRSIISECQQTTSKINQQLHYLWWWSTCFLPSFWEFQSSFLILKCWCLYYIYFQKRATCCFKTRERSNFMASFTAAAGLRLAVFFSFSSVARFRGTICGLLSSQPQPFSLFLKIRSHWGPLKLEIVFVTLFWLKLTENRVSVESQ